MKEINIQPKLNKAEKAIIEVIKRYNNHDLMDNIGMIKGIFIKLRQDTKELIIFSEPVKK